MFEYFTIDDFEFEGKIVGVRVDINSPVKNGSVMMNQRIKESVKTLKELQQKGARIVVLAHQGRKGEDDCISLSNHIKELKKFISEINFVEEIYSKEVEKAIANLDNGSVLLLENLRYYEDETLPDKKDNKIKKLEKFFDYYVFDAFSLAHRSQTSVIGFTKIPVLAGRIMEKEIKGLQYIEDTKKPRIFSLGGAKPDDLIPLIKYALENNTVDTVLLSGVIGEVGLYVQGYDIGKKQEFLKKKGWLECREDLKALLDKFPYNIEIPKDVVVIVNSKRIEIPLSQFEEYSKTLKEYLIQDIGPLTLQYYTCLINDSNSVYFKGPPGNFEIKGGEVGTKKLLSSITESQAFTFMGGGHSVTAAYDYGLLDKFSYVSLAGGALVKFLEKKELPGVTILENSHKKFDKINEDFIVIGSNTQDIGVKVPSKLSSLVLGDKVVIEEDFKHSIGGGGVNVSIALSRLGAKVGYLGKYSEENQKEVKEELEKNSITPIEVKKSKKPSAKSVILDTQDNDRIIFTYRGQNGTLEFDDFNNQELKAKHYYFTSLKGTGFQTLVKTAQYLHKNNPDTIICFNPTSYLIENEPNIKQLIKKVSIIVLNTTEAQMLTGEQKISSILKSLLSFGPSVAVVTAGSLGAYGYDGEKEYKIKSHSTKVVDTTGAGDSFAATFFYFYSKGYGMKRAMNYAAKNSSSVIGKKGAINGLQYRDDLVK